MWYPAFPLRQRVAPLLRAFGALLLLANSLSAQTLTAVREVKPRNNAMNVVFVSEGFTAAEQATFENYVTPLANRFISDEGFSWLANYINIYRLWVPSNESGADDPEAGIYRDTAFDGSVSGQYASVNQSKVTNALSPLLPEWTLVITLVHAGPYPRGTGWNKFATMTVFDGIDIAIFGDVMLHETGHAFAAMADEYTRINNTIGPTPVVNSYPNVTNESTRDRVPWSKFIMPWTPVPTTDYWYGTNEMGTIGAFPGAMYRDDLYRPSTNNRMASSQQIWSAVNLRAIATAVHRLNLDHPAAAPTITAQPIGGTATIGQSFTLSVGATGAGPLWYQWMLNGQYVVGGHHATYTISLMTAQLAGSYSVEVTNAAGSTVSIPVTVNAGDPPGGRWDSQDIGAVAIPGHAVDEVSRKHVHSAGSHIAGTSDAFHLQYQMLTGDGTITAEFVQYYRPKALPKAGIMIRESLDPAARYVGIFDVINTSHVFQSRTIAGGDTNARTKAITSSFPSLWRIQRSADTFTTYTSTDGTSWTAAGSATISGMPATLYAGLAVSSESQGDFATVVFRNTAVAPGATMPIIDDQSATGTQNAAFRYQIVARNASGFAALTPLPPGLTLNTSGLISGTPTSVGTTAVRVHTVSQTGSATADAQLTIRINAPPPAVPPPPVVSDAVVVGEVGTAITPLQLQATNSPTSFSAPALPDYGLQVSDTGLVTGTPTQTASGMSVSFQATNAGGTSNTGTITLNIAAAPVTPPPEPPPTTQPPPEPPPTTTPPPPTPSKTDQTITFSSPTSGLVIGQTVTLGATSSAGLPITYSVVSGNATVSGNTLVPLSTATLVVRASAAGNDAYNSATIDVNFGAPQKAPQQIATGAPSPDVPAEKPIALNATSSSGLPLAYTVVSGPAQVAGNTLTFTGTGSITVRISQPGDSTYAPAADATLTFNAHPVPRLINISSSVHVAGSADTAMVGFVVTGSAPKQMLVRAVGDSLVGFGIGDPLANPRLTLFDSNRVAIATNTGWANDPQIAAAAKAVGAFPLVPGKTDAAVIATLAPGAYTAHVNAANAGTVLFEVYDLGAYDPVPTKQLINVSTSGHVDAGTSLVQGFVIAGDQPKRVLIRAVGAGLLPYGVANAISDAALKVYSGQTVIAQNDNWETPQPLMPGQSVAGAAEITAANTATGAFPLNPGSKDAAVVLTLNPGAYSIVVAGSAAQNGTVLLEAYEVP